MGKEMNLSFTPIGYIESCFKNKNATPRQANISPSSKGSLKIRKEIFNCPEHSLDGIEEFSHVWIMFYFHLNSGKCVKSKVKPPRMNGKRIGVFSTRSPHRPNPVGLSLVKLDKVVNDTLYLSGLDLVHGTPVLDVKPYISTYDFPCSESWNQSDDANTRLPETKESLAKDAELEVKNEDNCKKIKYEDKQVPETSIKIDHSIGNSLCSSMANKNLSSQSKKIKTADWITNPSIKPMKVIFTSRVDKDLEHSTKQLITEILSADPRSTYRRNKCSDRLYYFNVCDFHVTTWFDYSNTNFCIAEVLRIIPSSKSEEILHNNTVK